MGVQATDAGDDEVRGTPGDRAESDPGREMGDVRNVGSESDPGREMGEATGHPAEAEPGEPRAATRKKRRPRPLPEALNGFPFARASAASLGVRDVWLQHARLHNHTRGAWCQAKPKDWRERAEASTVVLPPQSGFSHLTAARIHGLPLPWRLEKDEEDEEGDRDPADLHVITPSELTQRRRPGWLGHTGAELRELTVVDGLPVTGRVDTWIDLGSMAVGRRRELTVDDLVVAGDVLANQLIATQAAGSNRSRLGHAQRHLDPRVVDPVLSLIRARLDARIRPRLRGRTALEAALPLIRAGVKSPQETRARLMFVRAGFPEPLVNANIHVADGGGWLAEGDLVWRESRTVAEYQSEHHATRERRSYDSDRMANLRDEDWHAHEVWAEDLRPGARQHALLVRVRASLDRPL